MDSEYVRKDARLGRDFLRPLAIALASVCALLALGPAPSLAGSLSASSGTLAYTAAAGEANDVTISCYVLGSGCDPAFPYTVTDAGASVVGGTGCTTDASDAHTATCPSTGITSIRVDAGDGDDTVAVNAPTPSTLSGAAGNDTLSGGSGDDTLNGGLGDDSLQGNGGTDTAAYFGSGVSGVTVSIALTGPQDTGGGGTDTLDGIESLRGSTGNDTLYTRNGVAGSVNCLGGEDVAVLDKSDAVTNCEHQFDTTLESGPGAATNDSTPSFAFSSRHNSDFECSVDGGAFETCSSPFDAPSLSEGPHNFQVRSKDATMADPVPVAASFSVDTTAPQTNLTGPAGTIDATSATFTFSGFDEMTAADKLDFQCELDGAGFAACASPITYGNLAEGGHTFRVRTTDEAGNTGEAALSFAVALTPTGASGGTSSPPPVARPATSFILIGGNSIMISRRGIAAIRLNCLGRRNCNGRVTLSTARRVRFRSPRRRIVRLGTAKFFVPAPLMKSVKVRLGKGKVKLVRRLRRVKAVVTVTDRDLAGRTRISTRPVLVKAR